MKEVYNEKYPGVKGDMESYLNAKGIDYKNQDEINQQFEVIREFLGIENTDD